MISEVSRYSTRVTLVGIVAWFFVVILSLKYGSAVQVDAEIIAQLRIPRVLLASVIGMGLAVSGAVLQVLFSNPLCEPYTMGISSGSAIGAVVGLTLGFDFIVSGLLGSAFVGALIFTGILYLISRHPGVSSLTLLLTGVMLNFLGSSLVSLWMAVADSNGIQGALFWLMGDLSRARLSGALISAVFVWISLVYIWFFRRELDSLLLGEESALSLGVNVSRLRMQMVLVTSFILAVCVSAAGMVGFIGLVIPHFVRKYVGSLHHRLIPLSALWGAVALTLADLLARVLIRPFELPVGVVTALVGAPLFMWVILKQERA